MSETPATSLPPLSFRIETKVEDLMTAADVYDRKNGMGKHRALQMMGVFVILCMFLPEIFRDPSKMTNWIMSAAAVGLTVVVWKYPEAVNKRYALKRAEKSPSYEINADSERITAYDGTETEKIIFAEEAAAYEYKNVIVLNYRKGHLLTIPKDQLDEETVEGLRETLRAGLGDRFEKLEERRSRITGK